MKWLAPLLAAVALTACDYTEVERETGYKGKARMNPWLAAERFCEPYEGEVRSLASWTEPAIDDAVWFVPGTLLNNRSFTRRLDEWIAEGGHLVVMVDHASAESNDWHRFPPSPPPDVALLDLLESAGIELDHSETRDTKVKAKRIRFEDRAFRVDANSASSVMIEGGKPGVFASVSRGDGRLSVLTDARLFRNRWIGERQHAEFLDALVNGTDYVGNIGFTRGSALSLWSLLGEHLWPVLAGLALLTLLWLWKNFSRFGPIESAHDGSSLRGDDHHLEALGDFQWRLDRANALLAPLRHQIVESGQRVVQRSGHRDDDFFQFLANLAGLPRERVHRALTESAPPDTAILTRTTADLQRLLQVLH